MQLAMVKSIVLLPLAQQICNLKILKCILNIAQVGYQIKSRSLIGQDSWFGNQWKSPINAQTDKWSYRSNVPGKNEKFGYVATSPDGTFVIAAGVVEGEKVFFINFS